jgi:hypothetical protein
VARAALRDLPVTSFPVFESLTVRGYGLFPGGRAGQGIDLEFRPGLTLVLGANGLGKTTLVTLLYRLCSGPFDIRGLASGGDLGNRSVEASAISRSDRRIFASRVADEAAGATATLVMRLGDARVRITRSLESLTLAEFETGDGSLEPTEAAYQRLICEHAGLASFGDWILLLRHLVFYFEDRRALVWDASAQRQILRLLFLPPATAREWARLEREILERDSRMRNLQAAVSREEAALARDEAAIGDADDVRAELLILEKLQKVDEPKLEVLNDHVVASEADRQNARVAALQAELDRESAFRDLERHQLRAIEAAFPSTGDTARYLLGQMLTGGECLACGSDASQTSSDLQVRLASGRCVVCGAPLEDSNSVKPFSKRAVANAAQAVRRADERVAATSAERHAAEAAFDVLLDEIGALNASIATRRARIDALVRRLPPDEVGLHEQRDELATLRGRVEIMKRELTELRTSFAKYIQTVNRDIAKRKEDVKRTFERFAEGFLLEECDLVWAPHRARIGESGEQVAFPAFELEMGGASFPSPVRRTGPEQVSESQREFIDLAFRMTLMNVAGSTTGATLVIDAPESSLDAVFVSRAADVLTRFAEPSSENRLVVTSNLIEGDLIPGLIRRAKIRSAADPRIVDLLKMAAPTAATQRLKKEYAKVRTDIFARARRSSR